MLHALALGGCAAGSDRARWNAAECAVTVRFGSFAMGIDRMAVLRVERLIATEVGVSGVTRGPPGIEGDHALCIRTSSPAAAARLFERLRQALSVPVRAPVSVTTPDGRFFAPIERSQPRR